MSSLARAAVLATLVLACTEPEVATTSGPGTTQDEPTSGGEVPTSGDSPTSASVTSIDPIATDTIDPTLSPSTGTTTGNIDTTDTTTTSESSGTSDETSSSDTTGPDVCVDFSCSPEFDQVLCDGSLVEACAPGSYCVGDSCQPLTACEAAALLKRSDGCDFWAVKTQLLKEADGACFAAFIANTGDEPAHIALEFNGQSLPVAPHTRIPVGQGLDLQFTPYDAVAGLPVGEVAIIFLSRGPGTHPKCPVPSAAVPFETQVVGTGRGQAFHITSDVPVAAYQTLPFGGGSAAVTSATLLLPTSVWGTSYIGVNAGAASMSGSPLLTVVATEDATHITLRPTVAVLGSPSVKGGPAGVPIDYTLARGETLQITQPKELTGSPLSSDKPFAVFGGSTCLNLPTNTYACDGAHQQIPPIQALGHVYAATRYRDRDPRIDETPPWRLVGAVDDTILTYSPAKPPGAPDTLMLGQLAEFPAAGPFVVQSQDSDHPFYAAAFMTGGAPFSGSGDPDWVNLIPIDQYQQHYVFFTDPTYSETELVVVRRAVDGEFAPVNLDCLGDLVAWKTLGDPADGLEWTRHQLVTGNFKKVGNCSTGRREMTSENPFGVTVWGWGSGASELFYTQYVSYAYPAGATIRPINSVVIPQ